MPIIKDVTDQLHIDGMELNNVTASAVSALNEYLYWN